VDISSFTDRVALVTGGAAGIGKDVALALGESGVSVVVAPGFTDTGMFADAGVTASERTEAHVRGFHPMGRFGESKEIADAIRWLRSNEASYVTGTVLPVDGGYMSQYSLPADKDCLQPRATIRTAQRLPAVAVEATVRFGPSRIRPRHVGVAGVTVQTPGHCCRVRPSGTALPAGRRAVRPGRGRPRNRGPARPRQSARASHPGGLCSSVP